MPKSDPNSSSNPYSALQADYDKTWVYLEEANAKISDLKDNLTETWKVVGYCKDALMEFRRGLWLTHGHFNVLYGDDGEMQCSKCMVDFKRDSPERLLSTLIRRD